MFSGNDLINMGFKGGSWFKQAISHINDNNLQGEELANYLVRFVAPPTIEPLDVAVPYYLNVDGSTDDELTNIEAVKATMNKLMKTPVAINGAVMPEACPAGGLGTIPVGGIVVAKNAILPSMHSADICCSVYHSSFGNADPKAILDAAFSVTHFGYGGRKEKFEMPIDLEQKILGNRYLSPHIEIANQHGFP